MVNYKFDQGIIFLDVNVIFLNKVLVIINLFGVVMHYLINHA